MAFVMISPREKDEFLGELAATNQGLELTEGIALNVLDETFWRRGFEDLHSIKLAYSAIELNQIFGDEAIPLENLAQHWGSMR